jgi:hypothetical protein
MNGSESGCDLGGGEGQAMMLTLEILLPSRNPRFLTQINRILAEAVKNFHNLELRRGLRIGLVKWREIQRAELPL